MSTLHVTDANNRQAIFENVGSWTLVCGVLFIYSNTAKDITIHGVTRVTSVPDKQ